MDRALRERPDILYREPFEFARHFTGICFLASILSQIPVLMGISASSVRRFRPTCVRVMRLAQIECGRRSLRLVSYLDRYDKYLGREIHGRINIWKTVPGYDLGGEPRPGDRLCD